jgi:hypothetical protein
MCAPQPTEITALGPDSQPRRFVQVRGRHLLYLFVCERVSERLHIVMFVTLSRDLHIVDWIFSRVSVFLPLRPILVLTLFCVF